MPKIKKKEHKLDTGQDEDVELKAGRLRIYFQNRYNLISLINDFLVGIMYIFGSLAPMMGFPSQYGTYLYLAGGVFLTMRPVLKIIHNVYIYKDIDYIDEKELEAREEEEEREKQEDGEQSQEDEEKKQEDQEYNEEYYGDDKNEEYEKHDDT